VRFFDALNKPKTLLFVVVAFLIVDSVLYSRYQAPLRLGSYEAPTPGIQDITDPSTEPRASVPETKIRGEAIFLGDSYTEGQGASSPDLSYVRYAGEASGLSARPAAQGGTGIVADSDGVNGRTKFDDRLATTVFPEHPDVVVIAGGLNDEMLILDRRLKLAEYRADRAEYDKLIADIKTGLPEAKIVVLGPFCPESPTNRPILKKIRDANRAAAEQSGAPFIDVFYFDDKNKSSYITSDGIHPNDAGHEYLGEKLGADLVEALS
jgi:lysophospholipase L1-like esterase